MGVRREPGASLEAASSSDSEEDLQLDTQRRPVRFTTCAGLAVALLAAAALATAHRGTSGRRVVQRVVLEEKAEEEDSAQDPSRGFPVKTWWPTLFCWSVMNFENAQEVATIKGQVRNRTGIVGCDNFAVLSGKRMYLGKGHKLTNGSHMEIYSWYNPAHSVPMGNLAAGDHTNSFKNADIFIGAWEILIKSGALWGHNWTAKVDPDAVFFAYRLRAHMKKWTWGKDLVYFENCRENTGKPLLYGALEVVNERALLSYGKPQNEKGCEGLDWRAWGEDEWIDKCMGLIVHAKAKIDYKLVGDHRCMAAECDDIERVAYHDYKTESLYYDCWKRSKEAEKVKDSGYFCCTYGADCNSCAPQSRQWPGKTFCGGSEAKCRQCGSTFKWCQQGKDGVAKLVMK